MNTLTFRHQDGDMTFRVHRACFHVTPDNVLSLSVECREHPDFGWMATPCFCLLDYPLEKPLAVGTVVRFAGNEDDNVGLESIVELRERVLGMRKRQPRVRLYVGIHQEPRNVEVRVKRLTKESCDVEVSWDQKDVQYYDERARNNRTHGECKLKIGTLKNIWDPG